MGRGFGAGSGEGRPDVFACWRLSDRGEVHAGSRLRLARPLVGCGLRQLSLASSAQFAAALGGGFGLVPDV